MGLSPEVIQLTEAFLLCLDLVDSSSKSILIIPVEVLIRELEHNQWMQGIYELAKGGMTDLPDSQDQGFLLFIL